MHRCGSAFLLILVLAFAMGLSGCLGKSSPNNLNGGIRSVSLNPASDFSMDVGTSQVFTATATDANGHSVAGTVQFLVQSGNPGTPSPLSVAANGNACAGNWDSQVAICNPGTSGVALVTAVVNGVSSPPTTVYVHLHIDSLQIAPAQEQNPPFECFSQGQSWNYQGIAFSQGVDISNSVGPLSWFSTNTGVLRTANLLPNMPLNQVTITAENPGITQLYANVSGTTSNILPITTCLVQYIRLQAQGQTGSAVTVTNGSTVTLEASVVDTLGFTLTKPPLTWSTNNPEVVTFASETSSATSNSATVRANLGGADITASCTPPSCNIGVVPGMPVYASGGALSPTNQQIGFGAISVNVITTSKPPVYTAWATTNQCVDAPGCESFLFSVVPGNNPIGTSILVVPRTPNSFLFNYQTSSRLYMGSDQGLMFSDLSGTNPSVTTVSPSSTPCNVALCGRVVAISNDGKLAVVSDNISPTPQVYIFNSGNNSSTDIVLPNVVTAAAFSPDQSKIFLLTDAGTLYVYSTVDALAPVPAVTNGTDVAFSADSSIAFVAGSSSGVGSVSAFSTCSLPGAPTTELGTPVSTTALPLRIFASPNIQADKDAVTQNIFVLDPPYVEVLTAQFTQVPIAMTPPWPAPNQLTCNLPQFSFVNQPTTYNLSQGPFIPLYARLTGDGSELIVVAKKNPSVLVFNVANGTTSSVPLVNNGDPLAATASTDGSQVYVAACDQYQPDGTTCAAGSVHIINTTAQGDFQQVPFTNNKTNNLCNNLGGNAPLCVANLIAIRPQ